MRLYKYFAPSRAGVLKELSLRFTQAQDFNDPFEVLPNIEALMPPELLHDYLAQFEGDAQSAWREAIVKELATRGLPPQLADFFTYDVAKSLGFDVIGLMKELIPAIVEKNRDKFATDLQRTLGDRIGILSLSENPTSLLMWAHYASSHTGFLLELDSSNNFFNQPKRNYGEIFGSLLPVSYTADRPAVTMYDPTADPQIWAQRLLAQVFLAKSTDWAYEKEWRMFLPLDDFERRPHRVVDERIHLFQVPPEALTAVILGARISDKVRFDIESAVESNSLLRHVRILPARISIRRFEVTIGRAPSEPSSV